MPIGRKPITVLRRAAGVTYGTDGLPVRGPLEPVAVRASVQPMDSFRLLRVEEGLRSERWIAVISDQELLTADATLEREPDLILYDGERWQVHMIDAWPDGLIRQWTAYAYARQTPPGAP